MPKKRFSPDQEEWIKDQLQHYPAWEVLPLINKQFNINFTDKQFKSWRKNHKVFSPIRKAYNDGKSKLFPPEVIDYIKANYLTIESPYMAEKIKEIFGITYTAQQVKNYRHNHKLKSNLTGAYNEHRPNPHKGTKWTVPNSENTRFKRGNSTNKLPLLSVRKRPGAGNYHFIKIAEPNKWILYSRYLWEQANGPLKPGEKIKYLDGNPDNLSLDNMMIIDDRINGKCNNKHRYSTNPELTKTGILLSKLELKLNI